MHCDEGDMSELGERFYACFVSALDDAGLPGDDEFRVALRGYMRWAVDTVLSYRDCASVPEHLSLPRWGWDGLEG
jgi:hemoglobin